MSPRTAEEYLEHPRYGTFKYDNDEKGSQLEVVPIQLGTGETIFRVVGVGPGTGLPLFGGPAAATGTTPTAGTSLGGTTGTTVGPGLQTAADIGAGVGTGVGAGAGAGAGSGLGGSASSLFGKWGASDWLGLASLVSGAYGQHSDSQASRRMIGRALSALSDQEIGDAFSNYFPGVDLEGAGEGLGAQLNMLLNDPGKDSSVEYERNQEQRERLRNSLNAVFTNRMAVGGIDTGTGMESLPGLMQLTALFNAESQFNEVERDRIEREEMMRRTDIQIGATILGSIIQQVFGLQQARAGAAVGAAQIPQTSPWTALGQALGIWQQYSARQGS